ncbi:serine/threonine-protein kinase pim-2-like isoform X6 [Micropterus dolomieu]|uniref:serine/threonine-protein kinase pim-2-like isoform X6 n=1 Tax=Micropterus dolomieu TaxID=147949 RepID=UPI001E8DF977|nr:serine/threonine-protein kinase pim-2-like isoform X6 [Micropterus dolomieu]
MVGHAHSPSSERGSLRRQREPGRGAERPPATRPPLRPPLLTNLEPPCQQTLPPMTEKVMPPSYLSVKKTTTACGLLAAFEGKYEEGELLVEGGFGSVFAGNRKDDNLPVAIKHVLQINIKRTSMLLDGETSMIPLEVALLLKVKPIGAGTSVAVTLLDWFDLDDELILILERPVPCLDLIDYMNSRGPTLQEQEAKTIAKQLVDGLIEVHSRGVFHRDIKLDNILIQTGPDVPRVRLIDFGCGAFLTERMYTTKQGTYVYTTPEWFLDGWYWAEPTTVWQLGVVLFAILHGYLPFSNSTEIIYRNPDISDCLSFYCQSFLLSCLIKSPEARSTLETLRHHPWLI